MVCTLHKIVKSVNFTAVEKQCFSVCSGEQDRPEARGAEKEGDKAANSLRVQKRWGEREFPNEGGDNEHVKDGQSQRLQGRRKEESS